MNLMVYQVDVIVLISSDVGLCFVDIWSILEYIFWHLLWVLATSSFFWPILLSFVVPDSSHLQNHDFLIEFVSWVSGYLGYISVLQYKLSHLVPMLVHLLSSMLATLLILWYCFFVSPLVSLGYLLSCFFLTLLLLP